MKNTLLIAIDTEKAENQITFSKPEFVALPTDEKERTDFIINDLKTLTYGLSTFINMASEQGVGEKNLLLEEAIKILRDGAV